MHAVYLVGVNHRIQYTNADCGPEWSAVIRTFEDYIVLKAVELKVELLAEEFNQDGIDRSNATGCTVRDAAKRCGKRHLFCEPSMTERQNQGIDTPDKRELIWLRKLKDSNASSILFVCGDSHLSSFMGKLNGEGARTEILSNGWGHGWMCMQ